VTTDPVVKAIPVGLDRLQSRFLIAFALPVLLYAAVRTLLATVPYGGRFLDSAGRFGDTWQSSAAVSVFFALAVWRLRAATPSAAACGGLICLLVTQTTHNGGSNILASGLSPLVLLFLLTFTATKWAAKQAASTEEDSPRSTAQVIANLGVAGFFGSTVGIGITASWTGSLPGGHEQYVGLLTVPMLAALVEATADTVSSEIGQAFGGTPFLITTFRRVAPGTDGAITLKGTASGIAASALVAASAIPAIGTRPRDCLLAFICGISGLFFDSLLGATVERRGWIGNDLVNFLSTAFAAFITVLGLGHSWF
jgi:uncharacterized protein (TIGR00297 family)